MLRVLLIVVSKEELFVVVVVCEVVCVCSECFGV